MDIKAHLKQLSELHAPSGFEGPVRAALETAWQPLVDSFEVGRLGSLVGIKCGSQPDLPDTPRRRIMLCAHMDEIGLMVNEVRQGFVRVSRLGGIDSRILPGTPVIVHGRQALPGVVGIVPAFAAPPDKADQYPPLDELFIDLGLPAEQVEALVGVGDLVLPDAEVIELGNGLLTGKAFDDRACIAVITACLDALQSRKHVWDVLAVASVQEEVGTRGAEVEAYRLNPDLAVALDVNFGSQPGAHDPTYKLGGGAPISMGANFHPALVQAIVETAERLEIPLPKEPLPTDSGTDAWMIQISREGIPTALLNIPTRNMHTTVETVDLKDIERAGRLLAEFIAGLPADFLKTIVWDDESDDKSDSSSDGESDGDKEE